MIPTDEPPELGECTFSFAESPASLQSAPNVRQRVRDMVRASTQPITWLFDGVVLVEVEWSIHERLRWETDATADLDNILKPLLDGFTGPGGILVDDSQIRSLNVAWYSTTEEQQQVRVRFRFDPEHFLPKQDVVFVRVDSALCYPVPGEIRESLALPLWLAALKAAVATRDALS